MTRYRLDPTRCSVGVSPRPALVSAPVRASLIEGLVEIGDLDGNDGRHGSWPGAQGSFRVRVEGLPRTVPLLGRAALPWPDGAIELAGRVEGVEQHGALLHVRLRVDLGGRTAPLGASVRPVRVADDGGLDVVGRTIVDPRVFGISLPPLVNLVVHVRWRAALHPELDGPSPQGQT